MSSKFNEVAGGLLILILGTLLVEGWYWLADHAGGWLIGAPIVLWLLYIAVKWASKVMKRLPTQKAPAKAEEVILYDVLTGMPHLEESARERAIQKTMAQTGISRDEAERQLKVFGL